MKQTISPGVFIGVIAAVLVVAIGVVFLRGGSAPAKLERAKGAPPPNVAAEIQKYTRTTVSKSSPALNTTSGPMPGMGGSMAPPGGMPAGAPSPIGMTPPGLAAPGPPMPAMGRP